LKIKNPKAQQPHALRDDPAEGFIGTDIYIGVLTG
jgi:hypothetical protein